MDELLKQVITGLPNMAVALLALYWQAQRMDKLIDLQAELIRKYTDMVDKLVAQQEPAPE